MIYPYNSNLRGISINLRNNQTDAEKEMWNFLKINFPNFKFNRQLPVDNFIVDFVCKKLNLIIEVDGDIHQNQKEKDLERDNILLFKYKLKTLRFTNEQVYNQKEHMKKILNSISH